MSNHHDETKSDHQSGPKAVSVAGQAASAVGQRSMADARNARLAAGAIRASHGKQARAALSSAEFAANRAGEIRDAMGRAALDGGRSGAFEAVKGHFIEAMTIEDYNAAGKWVGKTMSGRSTPVNRAYDASRFVTKNGASHFAGGTQIKTSAHGVEKAIQQIESVKPGSACRATLLVSEDEVSKATAKAAGRIRVKGNGVTRAHATKRAENGVKNLAKDGTKATSQARALGKTGAVGALAGVAIGGICDARTLKNGELSHRHFAENRAIDAAEGAAGAVLGTAAASAVGATATAAIGTTAGATAAASMGAAGTAVVGAVGGMGTGGAAVAAVLGTVTAPVAIPVVAGAVGSIAVGVGVSKLGKRVRAKVRASREDAA